MLIVVTKDVVKNSDVVLAPITALEFRMLVCFSGGYILPNKNRLTVGKIFTV